MSSEEETSFVFNEVHDESKSLLSDAIVKEYNKLIAARKVQANADLREAR